MLMLLITATVFITGILPEQSAFGDVVVYTDKYELTFVKDWVVYEDARTGCINKGLQLVKVDEQSLTDAIKPLAQDNTYWLGAKGGPREENWQWIDGTNVGLPGNVDLYNNWNSGEPNNGGNSNCMGVGYRYTTKKEEWVDFGCTNYLYYICQRDFIRIIYALNFELTFTAVRKNQADAKASCIARGARLVKVDGPSLTHEINENIKVYGDKGYWIGATDKATEGSWVWSDGTSVANYTNWRNREPNGRRRENCASVGFIAKKWVDVDCDLMFFYICQRDLPIRATIGLSELTFNGFFAGGTDMTYAKAKTACENQSSRLVEIVSEKINTVVKREASISQGSFWTGGYWDNGWRWNSGALLRNGYTDWKSGYSRTQKCLSADHIGWETNTCSQQKAYICEQVKVNNLKMTADSIIVNGDGKFEINCTASGLPAPTVSWYNESRNMVSTYPDASIHQKKSAGLSTLVLQNANLSGKGQYGCFAWNDLISKRQYSSYKVLEVSVSGTPQITEIHPQSCNSSLFVYWVPNRRAVGFEHRISSWNSKDVELSITPSSTEVQLTIIGNLASSKAYIIEVMACADTSCLQSFKTSLTAATGGQPNRVESPVLTQYHSTQECEVSWSPPKVTPASVIMKYLVTMMPELVQTRGNNKKHLPNSTISTTKNASSTTISVEPNRGYTFVIQAETCAGRGPVATAQGACMTGPGIPTKMPSPGISTDDGIPTLSLEAPDETNGLISCVFVIIEVGGSAGSDGPFGLHSLNHVSHSDGSSGSYLAIAIKITSLNGPTEFKLGTGKNTSCDIYDTGDGSGRRRRDTDPTTNGEYTGQNLKLKDDGKFSVFVVSVTPTGEGEVQLQTSPPATFTTSAKQGSSSWVAPVVVILTLALLVGLIVIVFMIRKRNTKPIVDESAEDQGHQREEDLDAVVYENFSLQRARRQEYQNGILMSEFEETFAEMKENENHELVEQFKNILKICAESMPVKDFASDPNLKKKNRFRNILPFDHTRVPIRGNETGYINACYINGFKQNRKFIATQGPLPGTVNDFWLMVVEQKCRVVIMLTKDVEAGKIKCEKYWPQLGEIVQYGSVTVENRDEVKFSSFIKRTWQARLTDQVHDNPLIITQYQFLKWPDHGAPQTTSYLMRMHRAALATQKEGHGNPPMIIHCSAGAGRTGTFIGYDILLEEYQTTGRADVYGCVMRMRQQRVEMVQNTEQYIFLHKLILESYLFGDTDMESHAVGGRLSEVTRNGIRGSHLAKEFEDLSKLGPLKDSKSAGQAPMNQEMNVNMDIIPYNFNTVKLVRGAGESKPPYINASWVESYENAGMLIAAQGPMKSTARLFWRAVLDNHVTTIVMLNQPGNKKKEKCIQYWPGSVGEMVEYDDITITLTTASADGPIITRNLEVASRNGGKAVTQYQYSGWEADVCPEDGRGIISLIGKMQQSMQTNGGVVLVHCSDGAGRTGTFCAIANLLERLKMENRVDVFRAVKDLRDGRPGMVQTMDQYIFCYKVVADYLKSFELYSNF